MSEQVDIIIITQDKWFSYNRIWNEAQLTYIQIPTGLVCWVDGTTAEAYPTYDKEDLLLLVQNNFQEKYKFQCVRAGVVAALSVHARRENVDQGTEIGRRIYRTMAFVTKTEFKRVTGVDLTHPDCPAKVIQGLPTYEGNEGEDGTLLEPEDLPRSLKYTKVELFYISKTRHKKDILGAEGVFRPEQATERFSLAVKNVCASRPALMRGEPGDAHSWAKIRDACEPIRIAQLADNVVRIENQGAAVLTEVVSSTGLHDSGEGTILAGKRFAGSVAAANRGKRSAGSVAAISGMSMMPPPSKIAKLRSPGKTPKGGKGRKKDPSAVMSSIGSVLGDDDTMSMCEAAPGTPGRPCPGTPAGSAFVLSLEDSDSDGEVNITAILNGAKLGRSVRAVFLIILFVSGFHYFVCFDFQGRSCCVSFDVPANPSWPVDLHSCAMLPAGLWRLDLLQPWMALGATLGRAWALAGWGCSGFECLDLDACGSWSLDLGLMLAW